MKTKIERVIFELSKDLIKKMRRDKKFSHNLSVTSIPEGITRGVPKNIYDGYRKGLTSSCADVIIQSWQKGKPIVLFIKRKKPPFANCWWMMGGAIHAYRSIEEFLLEHTERKCSLRPRIEVLLGIYRTVADDETCDTIQPCYVGTVTETELSNINIDIAHKKFAFFTKEMLDKVSLHWYPKRTAKLALETARKI